MFIFLFPGGGRDLDSEPGAVLQTILRVHVQHLIVNIIFQSSQLVSPCQICQMPRPRAHTHVSLLPHLSVGQSPIVKTKPPLLSIKPVTLSRLHLWTPLTEFGSWYSPCGVFLKKQTNKQTTKKEPALLQPPCCSSRQHGNCLTNALNECVSFSSYQFVSRVSLVSVHVVVVPIISIRHTRTHAAHTQMKKGLIAWQTLRQSPSGFSLGNNFSFVFFTSSSDGFGTTGWWTHEYIMVY